jgi:hypothetical protein
MMMGKHLVMPGLKNEEEEMCKSDETKKNPEEKRGND